MIPINYWAVLVAAASSIVLGFLWYGPFFGKPWMKLMGFTKESMDAANKKGMEKAYALMVIGSLLMAYVMAHAIVFGIAYTGITGASGGMTGAFYYWIGFAVPLLMDNQLWEGKPWKLFWINASYRLVSFLVMGAILGFWI